MYYTITLLKKTYQVLAGCLSGKKGDYTTPWPFHLNHYWSTCEIPSQALGIWAVWIVSLLHLLQDWAQGWPHLSTRLLKQIDSECLQSGGSMTINWVLHTKKILWNSIVKTCFLLFWIPFYYLPCLLCQETCHCHVFNNTDISRILSGWKVNSFHTW